MENEKIRSLRKARSHDAIKIRIKKNPWAVVRVASEDGYLALASEAIRFKLARRCFMCKLYNSMHDRTSDLDDNAPWITFHPRFTHQVFPEEHIYGFKGLRIDIYFFADSLFTYFNTSYTEKLVPTTSSTVSLSCSSSSTASNFPPSEHQQRNTRPRELEVSSFLFVVNLDMFLFLFRILNTVLL